MLFSFYYRNSVDSRFKTLMWGGGGCMTYNGQHSNCDDPFLCFRFEFLNAITLSFQTEFFFHDYYKKMQSKE